MVDYIIVVKIRTLKNRKPAFYLNAFIAPKLLKNKKCKGGLSMGGRGVTCVCLEGKHGMGVANKASGVTLSFVLFSNLTTLWGIIHFFNRSRS